MRKVFFTLLLILAFVPLSPAKAATPIRILLVPGHDPEVWGAQYKGVKEANMNLAVARRVYDILKKDKRFKVWITRNADGYTQEFSNYFATHKDEIISFRDKAKQYMRQRVASGNFVEIENAPHNAVTENVSVILYGTNKWANENKMDAVIHMHFNDYPREDKWTIGRHTGFVIYMPEGQLANSQESAQLAANIFIQLDKKYSTSTYEKELGGLIPDQKLIALGANDTLLSSVRSVLVEYAYIYEKRLRNYTTRHQAYNDMAKLTTAGIKKYFFSK